MPVIIEGITIGSRVRFLDTEAHERFPEHYPKPGTIGIVYGVSPTQTTLVVRWPNSSVTGDGYWAVKSTQIEKVTA